MDPVVITIKGAANGEIIVETSEGAALVIKENATNAKAVFELLNYEPNKQYIVKEANNENVKDQVFEEFVGLMKDIVKGINDIEATQYDVEDVEEAENSTSPEESNSEVRD